jgi:hypothetical protein
VSHKSVIPTPSAHRGVDCIKEKFVLKHKILCVPEAQIQVERSDLVTVI